MDRADFREHLFPLLERTRAFPAWKIVLAQRGDLEALVESPYRRCFRWIGPKRYEAERVQREPRAFRRIVDGVEFHRTDTPHHDLWHFYGGAIHAYRQRGNANFVRRFNFPSGLLLRVWIQPEDLVAASEDEVAARAVTVRPDDWKRMLRSPPR